jgi:hypothetical protein
LLRPGEPDRLPLRRTRQTTDTGGTQTETDSAWSSVRGSLASHIERNGSARVGKSPINLSVNSDLRADCVIVFRLEIARCFVVDAMVGKPERVRLAKCIAGQTALAVRVIRSTMKGLDAK